MLGENIELGLLAAQLNKEEFAKKLGVSARTVKAWIEGTSFPNSKRIIDICNILGTDPNHLLDYKASDAKMHETILNDNIVRDLVILMNDLKEQGDY